MAIHARDALIKFMAGESNQIRAACKSWLQNFHSDLPSGFVTLFLMKYISRVLIMFALVAVLTSSALAEGADKPEKIKKPKDTSKQKGTELPDVEVKMLEIELEILLDHYRDLVAGILETRKESGLIESEEKEAVQVKAMLERRQELLNKLREQAAREIMGKGQNLRMRLRDKRK